MKGPFYLAESKVMGPFRQNDGSFIIMRGVRGSDDAVPILHTLPQIKAKRGQGWNTPDPEGEKFARDLVDLLNKTYPA